MRDAITVMTKVVVLLYSDDYTGASTLTLKLI